MSKVRGFTLIELLIVIAVLGILAVAVLSAINPIEQINRSRDTGSRSDAEQLLSAIDRFYASKGYYPWTLGADSANTDLALVEISADDQTFGADLVPMLTDLTTETSELKTSFVTRIVDTGYNSLWIYNRGGQSDSTYVCFVPKSDSFLDEAEARCVDAAGSGLPEDLQDVAATLCAGYQLVGAARVVYSCLP